jgi:TPP-dependent indolepyruvate ferredoxin oxidoreductase alpha subunit
LRQGLSINRTAAETLDGCGVHDGNKAMVSFKLHSTLNTLKNSATEEVSLGEGGGLIFLDPVVSTCRMPHPMR